MKEFLNRFMGRYRNLSNRDANTFRETFTETVALIYTGIGTQAFRIGKTARNAAVIDSLMVGVAEMLDAGADLDDPEDLRTAYDALMTDEAYRNAVERATADEESVKVRLEKVRSALADLT